jgi:hypothetical protein
VSVLEDLSEDECYLYAIMLDKSGIDLAEFSMTDDSQDDGCFRAWPFQWAWWRNEAKHQLDQGSRSLGKSLGIKIRSYAFPFNYPGQEMVITAPEGIHLDAITDVIETAFMNNRLGREMLIDGRQGIKHRPFHINFKNGARIMGRIPQRDGKGMKGIHPIILELDEGQDFPEAGFNEVVETLKQGFEGAIWRVHGVTRGVVGKFYEFSKPDSGWTVHHLPAMFRPTWSDTERSEKIMLYGSRNSPDYRRNVLGMHGDSTSPLVNLYALMACVREIPMDKDHNPKHDHPDTIYNHEVYFNKRINNEQIEEAGDVSMLLDFPRSHQKYRNIWIGMDVGYTISPSAIVVFGEETDKNNRTILRLLTRVEMERVSNPNQVDVILHFLTFYQPLAFSMDKHGIGLPLYQDIQGIVEENPDLRPILDMIKGYSFSEKILVDFDQTVKMDDSRPYKKEDKAKEAGVYRNTLEYSSDKIRQLFDDKRLILPFDRELIGQIQGQTVSIDKGKMDMYGRRRTFSKGNVHSLDAMKMMGLGFIQHEIEMLMKSEDDYDYPDIIIISE